MNPVASNGDTIHLLVHWQGDHTELTFQKTRTGEHQYVTDAETVELIRSLARIQPDSMIASILNRMRRRTAHEQSWNRTRVCAMRNHHAIEAYREGERQARDDDRQRSCELATCHRHNGPADDSRKAPPGDPGLFECSMGHTQKRR